MIDDTHPRLMKLSKTYDDRFYASQADSSYRSAIQVWPSIFSILPPVKSVLDIGSGLGTWLKAAKDVDPNIEIMGVDHPGLNAKNLLISSDNFIGVDLTKSFDLKSRFDLAISLEVAEHIPAFAAEIFIENLLRHSPIVVFSAAVPGQGGTSHVNEQWPNYWIEKFSAKKYQCYDVLRPIIWNNERVEFWYRQNTFIFGADDYLNQYVNGKPNWSGHSLVHPVCLEGGLGIKGAAKVLAKSLARRFGRPAGK